MSENRIEINIPQIQNNQILYNYHVSGEWRKAFNHDYLFYIEYDRDISAVPEAVAIIPFLANILPMAWLYDAEIVVPVCDRDFYESIPKFKKGYMEMYPMIHFGGNLKVEKLDKRCSHQPYHNGAFFSGGVDAFNTLVNHMSEKLVLITLWGADVELGDIDGWNNVQKHLISVGKQFEIDYVKIKSTFRRFLCEDLLDKKVFHSGDGWWHGFQHGLGIYSHAAPVAYILGLKNIYFASSFTAADKGKVTCASDPTIDNNVYFCGAHIVHDGYEFTRQMKVHNIIQYAKKEKRKVSLRVCWESTGGSNCCNCEKCWRTILAIYAEGENPKEYGFEYSKKQLGHLARRMRYEGDSLFGALRYSPIQRAMRKNCIKSDLPKDIQWFYDIDFKTIGKSPIWRKILRKGKRGIKKILSYKKLSSG